MTYRVAKLNYVWQAEDSRDFVFTLNEPVDLPWIVDLRDSANCGPILDQLDLGACVANACSNALRFCLAKERAYMFQPCRLFIYYNARSLVGTNVISAGATSEDSGISVRDCCKAITKWSACDERNWPYIIRKFAEKPHQFVYDNAAKHKTLSYVSVMQELEAIKGVIASGYPVVFGIVAYESLVNDSTAASAWIPSPDTGNEKIIGAHCMCIYGYDMQKQAFIVQNSWGADWGANGYALIPFAYVLDSNLAGDFWTFKLFK